MNKVCFFIIIVAFFGCRSNKSSIKNIDKPISYEVFRLNFIDTTRCTNCISASFLTRIDTKSIIHSENLIFKCNNRKKINDLLSSFESYKSKKNKFLLQDNTFLIRFNMKKDKDLIYSYIGKNKWLLNDSIIVEPNKNIFQLIKSSSEIEDFTDYKNVGKAISSGSK
ncbi:MAG: hypothetical protein ACK46Y_02065 [Fluviicola sp.]